MAELIACASTEVTRLVLLAKLENCDAPLKQNRREYETAIF
jgi:hypothetical protein